MDIKKPIKSLNRILHDALNGGDHCVRLSKCFHRIDLMRDRAHQLAEAYESLRNIRVVLSRHGATEPLIQLVNQDRELERAVGVEIPHLTDENKMSVAKDLIEGINNTMPEVLGRLENYAKDVTEEITRGVEQLQQMASDQKAVLCDLRLHIGAIPVTLAAKESLAGTTICMIPKGVFTERIFAINALHKVLDNSSSEWNQSWINRMLNKLGYQLNAKQMAALDPEVQPEEPLEPEIAVVPKEDDEDGSDQPLPVEEIPENNVASTEQPVEATCEQLGWTRETMHNAINSLIAAVDKIHQFDNFLENVEHSTESLSSDPALVDATREVEQSVISCKNYLSLSSSLLAVYGREVNKLVNQMIQMVVTVRSRMTA